MTSRQFNSSRLGPTTRPFSPQHRFGTQDGSEQFVLKPSNYFGSSSKNSNIQLYVKENIPNKDDQKLINAQQCEIERLNNQLIRSTTELEIMCHKFELLQLEHEQLDQQLAQAKNQDVEIFYNEFQSARQQCEDWKQRCQELEIIVRQTSTESKEQITEGNMRMNQLQQEVERLSGLIPNSNNYNLEQFHQQINQQRDQITYLENQLRNNNLLREYEQRQKSSTELHNEHKSQRVNNDKIIQQISWDLNVVKSQLDEKSIQIDQFVNEKAIYQNRISDDENKKQILATEIDRLQQFLRQRGDEQQKSFAKIDCQQIEIQRLNQIIMQKSSHQKTYDNSDESRIQIERLNILLNKNKDERSQESKETERLICILKKYEIGIKDYEGRLTSAHQELHRLQGVIKLQELDDNERIQMEDEFTSEINTWRTKFCELNRDYHQLQEHSAMCQAELEASKAKLLKSSIVRNKF